MTDNSKCPFCGEPVQRQHMTGLIKAEIMTLGFPQARERVTVRRAGGSVLVARLDVKPNALFRDKANLHWLTDDDKFADVSFDPIISWTRELEKE